MIQEQAKIRSNVQIAKDVYQMVLETKIGGLVQCGQFVQVAVPSYFLRRPISVNLADENTITLVYKVVGDGTKVLSTLKEDTYVDVFGPLGTPFPVADRDVVLIGGGVGVPPLLQTADTYLKNGKQVTAVLGFNSKEDIILKEQFEQRGVKTYIATMDGSYGTKGTVIDAIHENKIDVPFLLSCGPLPMLKALSNTYTDGYISLEARMACGIGACMGCVVKDQEGNSLRVCKDGPVFPIGKVVL